MDEIKIEKGIPLAWGFYKYPFAEMEVGDSFLIPDMKIGRMGHIRKQAEMKTGFEFTCRTVPGGVRVWRVR